MQAVQRIVNIPFGEIKLIEFDRTSEGILLVFMLLITLPVIMGSPWGKENKQKLGYQVQAMAMDKKKYSAQNYNILTKPYPERC